MEVCNRGGDIIERQNRAENIYETPARIDRGHEPRVFVHQIRRDNPRREFISVAEMGAHTRAGNRGRPARRLAVQVPYGVVYDSEAEWQDRIELYHRVVFHECVRGSEYIRHESFAR